MTEPISSQMLPLAVRESLDAVRRRIRAYVLLQGIAIVIATAGVIFWVGLAIDWYFEPSGEIRRVGIIAAVCIAVFTAYRYLLRRLIVPISDTTLALLLERRFSTLKDHLITSVDVASQTNRSLTFHPELVARTNQAAAASVSEVETSELFNLHPLLRSFVCAVLLAASIVTLAIFSQETFGIWLKRIALSDEPWPRRVHLEVVGFTPDETGQRVHKVAQDDSYELLVHAGTTNGYEVPSEVEIRYRLPDGRHGRDPLDRIGQPSTGPDGFQLFRYEFKHVGGDMDFDVVGGDDRVRNLHLKVVDRPELVAFELECVYPTYIERLPRRLPVTGGMRIPEGTRILLRANSTKPLTSVRILDARDKHENVLTFPNNPEQKLQFDYGVLSSDNVLLLSVTDTDGVTNREPYRISLSALKDEIPQVAVRLSGISTAITPDATIPFVGKITDDYALDRVWYEYQVNGGSINKRSLSRQPDGQPSVDKLDAFDTRTLDNTTGKRAIELKPKQKLTLSLKAADRFNLTNELRAGSSQQFILDVVTPADLLALLERRELALRQRFESIYEKLTDTRNLLSRVASEEWPQTDKQAGPKTAEKTAAAGDDRSSTDASPERLLSRTRLRIAGSIQNIVQSVDEVTGVAEGFDDLGEELDNNRIDNPDLKSRLKEQIARPLRQIAGRRMPQLAKQLKLVEDRVQDPSAMTPELKTSISLADQTLVEMKQVLDRMLELQNYNEVIALLRDIISDQDQINQRTKERQKERLRSLFQD
jgi:hypothetical protein